MIQMDYFKVKMLNLQQSLKFIEKLKLCILELSLQEQTSAKEIIAVGTGYLQTCIVNKLKKNHLHEVYKNIPFVNFTMRE